MLKQGDIVYIKKCSKTNKRRAEELSFQQGQGFALLLGSMGTFSPDLTGNEFMAIMGGIGFIALGDVAKFLGEDAAKECMTKFIEKYHPKQILPQEEQVNEARPGDTPSSPSSPT